MFVALVGLLGLVVGGVLRLLSESVPDHNGGGRAWCTCDACSVRQPLTVALPIHGALRSCGSCGSTRQRGRVAIDITSGLLFMALAARVGREWTLPPILLFAAALVALSAIDLERFRLPDRLLFPSILSAGALLVALSGPGEWSSHLVPALVGMLAYGVLLLVPNLIAPSMLGFGDVKLALLLGLFLGWVRPSIAQGLTLIIWALIAGMLFGILSGVLVGIGRRVFGPTFLEDPDYPVPEGEDPPPIHRTAVPMGPGLAIGAMTVLLWSGSILEGPGLL